MRDCYGIFDNIDHSGRLPFEANVEMRKAVHQAHRQIREANKVIGKTFKWTGYATIAEAEAALATLRQAHQKLFHVDVHGSL